MTTTTYRVTNEHGDRGTCRETVRQNGRGNPSTLREFWWDGRQYFGGSPEAPTFGPEAPSALPAVSAPSAPSYGRVVASGVTTDGRTVTTDAAAFADWEEVARAACAPSVRERLARMAEALA